MKIIVGDTELSATFADNATSRALIERMPMTLPMMDLYGREMCFRFSGVLQGDRREYKGVLLSVSN